MGSGRAAMHPAGLCPSAKDQATAMCFVSGHSDSTSPLFAEAFRGSNSQCKKHNPHGFQGRALQHQPRIPWALKAPSSFLPWFSVRLASMRLSPHSQRDAVYLDAGWCGGGVSRRCASIRGAPRQTDSPRGTQVKPPQLVRAAEERSFSEKISAWPCGALYREQSCVDFIFVESWAHICCNIT